MPPMGKEGCIFDFRGADLFYHKKKYRGIVPMRTAHDILLGMGQRCPIQIENYWMKCSKDFIIFLEWRTIVFVSVRILKKSIFADDEPPVSRRRRN